ncbi:hypothetical protein PIB30_028796 [Stylosanthes scabra]|uniref:Uncharacterized protein n=1 Tax=Stylosanthes scabra TaxID=79078 RepID=A0ABU6RBA8_9FABA|nr:hypothetical protein [Stylosanthes scabra]
MFQRPRTVALEYEKPGMYGSGLIPPTRPFDRVWLHRLRDNHLQLGLVIRESRINLVATPRAERSSKWRRCRGVKHVEYSSDSGSDGYYSCKEETIPYKNLEWQQRNLPDELFKILAQERNEIREVQKKTEVQLGLLIKLATLIVETLTNSSTSRQEYEVLAVTLRSGKQLEKPPLTTHHIPPEIPKKVDIQHGERNTQDMPEAVTTCPQPILKTGGKHLCHIQRLQ